MIACISASTYSNIPIQESGRIKPLDTYARNQLLLLYGKTSYENNDEKIKAIDWLFNLLVNPFEELDKKIFYISNWENSPEVEVSLGLDVNESHRYSFYEIIEGFKNNQNLLDGLKLKSQDSFTNVENQIINVYNKLILFDEIAHSFTCFFPLIEIQNISIKESLGLGNHNKVSYSFFVRNVDLFSPLMQELIKTKPENWTEKHYELQYIVTSLHEIERYNYAQAVKIIPPINNDGDWLSPWEIMDHKIITIDQIKLITDLEYAVQSSLDNLINFDEYIINYKDKINSSSDVSFSILDREVDYNQVNYFFISLLFYFSSFLLGSIGLLTIQKYIRLPSLLLLIIGFLIHSYGIIIRMIVMQRPPVSTLYESIIFVGFVVILLGIIFELVRRDSSSLLISSVGGIILHYIGMKYAADGDTLEILVAVLNSNFWLSIHVTTITFGYGVSIIAGLMAHAYLFQSIINSKNKIVLKKIFDNTYILTLVALFFTLFGTILGGIWADQSWGRFWGWDPKENGALLIVMWHLMMLHMKVSGMVKELGFVLGVSLVNIVVALAWFGVNLLSVGLHSYGFTDSIAFNLFTFITIEIILCLGSYIYIKKT